jgi:DNA-binding GntR family transcriptional regulator
MQKLTFRVRPLEEVLHPDDLGGDGSLVEQIYALLRVLIINLSLPPDFSLVEQEVASQLKVSKTPVREAIIRLSREGLVKVVPKSGSYVTPISLDRYLEACFIRTQLEVGCVRRLAAIGVSLADQVTLRAHISDQRSALRDNDDAAFFDSDESLHKTLFDLAGLPSVWEMMNYAKAELDRVRHLKRQFGIRQRRLVVEEHEALINAIIIRNPVLAEQALLENIGTVEDKISSISDHPQLLRTIQDLNELVELDQRKRGGEPAGKMSTWT